jgi:death on curing protein
MMNNIKLISIVQVCQMHDQAVQKYGGRLGIHDQGLLESAVNHPAMILEYGNIEEQELTYLAAIYFFHIIKNHPFIDGNKRAGLLTALQFLAQNNCEFINNKNLYDDLYQLAIDAAMSCVNTEDIAKYFKKFLIAG